MKKFGRKILLVVSSMMLCMNMTYMCFAISSSDHSITLTQEEQQYIEEHPSISIAIDTSWVPYGFKQADGSCGGIIPNLLKVVANNVGLQVKCVAKDTYAEAIEACTSGETTLVSGIANDQAMADKYNLIKTDPYIQIDYSAVSRNEIEDLFNPDKSLKAALCVGTYAKNVMMEQMPSTEFVEYHNNEECMDAVLNHEVDVALIASYSVEYFRNYHKYDYLQSIQLNHFNWGLSFGVNHDVDPILISILNKGIQDLSEIDVNQAIYISASDTVTNTSIIDFLYNEPIVTSVIVGVFVAILASILFLIVARHNNEKNLKLEQKLRIEAEDALKTAEEANSAKSDFLSRVSHDMRTPMNGILGVAELSKDVDDQKILKQNMKKIEESGQYLLGLINDTLDFQKIQSGKLVLSEDIVDSQEVVHNVVDMVMSTAETKNIDFVVENSDPEAIYVRTDEMRIKQIFMNLLSNAIKFTPVGGSVTWRIDTLDKDDEYTHKLFRIIDTGVGMSEEYLKNGIFKPFSQEQNTYSTQYAGSGLGLSIVKNLVDMMGGTIEVVSEQGKGTIFSIDMKFPLVGKEEVLQYLQGKRVTPNEEAQDRLKGNNILLVEDHPLNAEIAIKILTKFGCKVTWANNGEVGLHLFNESKIGEYQAILMDIRMPVMDGIEATKEIRKLDREDAKSVPIIAMTANAFKEDIDNCINAGMNEHLRKPIDIKMLYNTLGKYLGKNGGI